MNIAARLSVRIDLSIRDIIRGRIAVTNAPDCKGHCMHIISEALVLSCDKGLSISFFGGAYPLLKRFIPLFRGPFHE